VLLAFGEIVVGRVGETGYLTAYFSVSARVLMKRVNSASTHRNTLLQTQGLLAS
jgi:hypothetical protein